MVLRQPTETAATQPTLFHEAAAPERLTGKRLVVVLPCRPWPLRANGISIRYLPILRHLAQSNRVTVLILNDPAPANGADAADRDVFDVEFIETPSSERTFPRRVTTFIAGVSPVGPPYPIVRWYDRSAADAVTARLTSLHADLLIWAARDNSGALWRLLKRRQCPIVVDYIDSPTLNESRNDAIRHRPVRRMIRLWAYRRWECAVRRLAHATIYISATDADAAGCRPGTADATVEVIANGFTPEQAEENDAPRPSDPVLGYLGHMGYGPNVSAALRLYHRIYRPLRQRIPSLRLHIIGRAPAAEIQALARDPSVLVTGEVTSVAAQLQAVDVMVLPLTEGAGLQNKLLEALWANRRCLISPLVAGGVGSDLPKCVQIADTDAAFRSLSLQALSGARTNDDAAADGRQWVEAHFGWPGLLERYEALLARVCATPAGE